MSTKSLAGIVGAVVLLLGFFGLAIGEGQFMNVMNIDIMLDLTKIALGAVLIGSAFMDERAAKTAFGIFGVVYLGAFIASLISPTLFGMLPSSVGIVDAILHLGGGLVGVAIAFVNFSEATTRTGKRLSGAS